MDNRRPRIQCGVQDIIPLHGGQGASGVQTHQIQAGGVRRLGRCCGDCHGSRIRLVVRNSGNGVVNPGAVGGRNGYLRRGGTDTKAGR